MIRQGLVPVALLFFVFSGLFAQTNDSRVRWQYTNENAPQHVVFGIFLRHIFSTSLRPHDGRYGQLQPGANENTDLTAVFDYLVLLWIEQDKEIGETKMRMLCPTDDPRPRGKAIFAVFDALDDARQAINYKYYAIAKSELVARFSFDLDKALDHASFGFSQTALFHEKSYGGSIEDAEQVAAGICENGHGSSFTTISREPG